MDTIRDFQNKTLDECRKLGVNDSMIHEDFMIGSADLSIDAVCEDGKTVAAMDCLVPGIGEIIGGSQREDNLEKLEARMDERGLKKEDYGFYLDLRKYGSARHSGFGLGFERCVMYLTGVSNIRDVIPFPRTVNNCEL